MSPSNSRRTGTTLAKPIEHPTRWGTQRPRQHLGPGSELQVLDELDRALIEQLRIDGRESSRSLAKTLRVNEVTVAGRLRRLEECDIMRVVAVTDIRLFGHRDFAFALVRVTGRAVEAVANELALLPETVSVTICTGRCDIIVTVLGRDHRHIGALLDSALRGIKGVDEIRGSMALDVLKYDSNWALLAADVGTLPEAHPTDTIDEVDLGIIRMLQQNARRSNRSIAAELGVSEGTVRGRIKHMLAERVFHIQAVSDIAAFGIGTHAFIGIRTEAGSAAAVAAALVRRGDVTQLTRVIGDFDMIALLVAPDRNALATAILTDISLSPGIRSTETFETFASLKHNYAWTWIV
ncbi:Lrp/AsnC family transcriptional regulator [Nocardia sp. NPDC055029]